MKTFQSGASSSELKPRYDLIPFASLQRLADRLTLGAAIHGDNNYQKGGDDFWTDRKNHLVEHLLKYLAGDESDDHLGAVLCNAAMLAWKESKNN